MINAELLTAHHQAQIRRGNLPRSIYCRQAYVRSFSRWLGDKDVLDAERADVERWLDSKRIGARTVYSTISHLHAFYAWAIDDGRTDDDPTAKIVRPKMRRTLPRPADTAELVRALEVGNSRQRAWIALAGLQGLRCQEIAGMRREDVLEAEMTLRITHGKGATERLLPLHPEVLGALQALPMPRVGWVFRRTMGGPYSPAQVSQEFNAFLRDAGVNATAHQLRHWFGSHLYAQTKDLRMVQEMLGHASPTTTAIYTAFDHREAIKAVGSLNFAGG